MPDPGILSQTAKRRVELVSNTDRGRNAVLSDELNDGREIVIGFARENEGPHVAEPADRCFAMIASSLANAASPETNSPRSA